jgi:hypothetical protein
MPNLDTAYLSTILTEEQRTLLRFAVQLGVPILIDDCSLGQPETGNGLIAHLRAIGADATEAQAINDLDEYDEAHPAYIVLALHNSID